VSLTNDDRRSIDRQLREKPIVRKSTERRIIFDRKVAEYKPPSAEEILARYSRAVDEAYRAGEMIDSAMIAELSQLKTLMETMGLRT
jgi:hypothetical protein